MSPELYLLTMQKETEETLLLAKSTLRYLDIIEERVKASNEELQELITFFQEREYYEQCEKLKKYII